MANRGIKPGKISTKDEECCIGFCGESQTWSGWRIDGKVHTFGIGSIVKKCYNINSRYHLPVGFKAETLDDCKRMAIAYAGNK